MSRITREKRTINAMVKIYCHDHHADDTLCQDCQSLLEYAQNRLDKCPFDEKKPACNKCTVHCYSVTMREHVRQVMRYAGPRMILKHPLLALQHFVDLLGDVPVLGKKKP